MQKVPVIRLSTGTSIEHEYVVYVAVPRVTYRVQNMRPAAHKDCESCLVRGSVTEQHDDRRQQQLARQLLNCATNACRAQWHTRYPFIKTWQSLLQSAAAIMVPLQLKDTRVLVLCRSGVYRRWHESANSNATHPANTARSGNS